MSTRFSSLSAIKWYATRPHLVKVENWDPNILESQSVIGLAVGKRGVYLTFGFPKIILPAQKVLEDLQKNSVIGLGVGKWGVYTTFGFSKTIFPSQKYLWNLNNFFFGSRTCAYPLFSPLKCSGAYGHMCLTVCLYFLSDSLGACIWALPSKTEIYIHFPVVR